jgi:hypothetical protein
MTAYKLIFKDLFLDAVLELLYFPVWWYSRGLKKAAFFCWKRVKDGWRVMALSILIRNVFKPMYAQRGWDAYVLSMMVRLFQLFWRFLFMFLWFFLWVLVLLAWLVLPVFAVYKFIS